MTTNIIKPPVHSSGAIVPSFDKTEVPHHIAIVMDGNGRWANARNLPRTEGHKAGELSLMDVIAGAIDAGIKVVSVYAFSTENWRRSPQEVAFLMGYSRDVIHQRRDELNAWGVKVVWSGREPRLWKSVIKELKAAEELTKDNDVITLNFCVNYGGQAEITDAVREIAQRASDGKLKAQRITPDTIARHLYQPQLPPVDLFIRTGGEQRISNFMLWQSSYAELMFVDEAWPDFDRLVLWDCISRYANRDRRFGTAVDTVTEG
ncbi:isoprenyl transferase [Arcanobacterium ihumii]|uniref:isoprenyl transferase n=1 Tax=Arcanobacterium ihumii TaxID=2138162 RepID=UPI000F535526|nr:isoprenyl transferase [Arcanobacterium ihumii]